MSNRQLAYVMSVYEGSNGDATRALYTRLEQLGPAGTIAAFLLRAQKNSARAKVYRGGGYRGMAYDRKQWALDQLTKTLTEHAQACGIEWGWGTDDAQSYHKHVLYVELPNGQVSFHTDKRGEGPTAPRDWDGVRGVSPQRICVWAAQILSTTTTKQQEGE